MDITPDTWIISDTHFWHTNIIEYCGRPFDHDSIMVTNWCDVVAPDDTVLHLGDVAWIKDVDDFNTLIGMLPGTKYLLLGNHDKGNKKKYYDAGFKEVVNDYFVLDFDGTKVAFSHYPLTAKDDVFFHLNIHGHIHNNDYHKDERMPDRRYFNASVEMINYRPVRLREILNETE